MKPSQRIQDLAKEAFKRESKKNPLVGTTCKSTDPVFIMFGMLEYLDEEYASFYPPDAKKMTA